MIVKTTYKDQIVEHIYEMILEGVYSPGDQLKESALAEEMGISRAPVREALKELVSNGLIEYKPQIGNFIALLPPKEIIDAYTTRDVLEGYAIMEARDKFSEDEIETLREMAAKLKKYADRKNHKKVVSIGGDFHNLLISKNKNVQLAEYSERLSLKLHVLFYKHWSKLYTPEEIGIRHLRIVSSLVSGDPVEREKRVRDHYAETGTKIASLQN